jgi:hypothetical protein
MTIKQFGKRLSDAHILGLMLMVDGNLSHVEISEQFPDSKFVLLMKGGAEISGVLTGHDSEFMRLRAHDGNIVAVRKKEIQAVRRPIVEK